MDFQIGDVVMLKSGGPEMTVSFTKGDEVWCMWFVTERFDAAKEQCFKAAVLKPVQPLRKVAGF